MTLQNLLDVPYCQTRSKPCRLHFFCCDFSERVMSTSDLPRLELKWAGEEVKLYDKRNQRARTLGLSLHAYILQRLREDAESS
jgi:hypothetical protein